MSYVNKNPVTVIVPVYGDWPSLDRCIKSLISNVETSTSGNKVLLVNDCGPDADKIEKKIKAAIKGERNYFYFRNNRNLGFIGNCNRAVFELDKTSNDVLLLNSDTKTTNDFLETLQSVLARDQQIAAVSPRSNNATLATIPLKAAASKDIEPRKSYEIFQKYRNKFPLYTVAPVAHGFCMLIRRSVIEEHGLFDPKFGKGYGEEVDFCRRVMREGWKSAICNHAYVFHEEAKSFSIETKMKLLEKNNQIIWKRYPNYRQEVRDYMTENVRKEEKLYQGSFSYFLHKAKSRFFTS